MATVGHAAPRPYEGHRVVRIAPADPATVNALVDAGASRLDDRPGPGSALLRVPPHVMPSLLASGARAEVLTTNLQDDVDAERARLLAGPASHGGGDFFADFRPLADVQAHLDGLLATHPDLVTHVDVGTSLEGRTLRAVSIHAGAPDDPAIFLSGTMHAREWLSTTTTTCLASTLANGYGSDDNITAVLDAVNIVVLPVSNPDGYVYSWDVERYWRKNRRDGVGVDLNRNFPWEWGGPGSSDIVEEENYRGTGPLSEPESTALADLMTSMPTLVAHVDYHTFGELLLYPWGYTAEPPGDIELLETLAEDQVAAMEAAGGENYTALQGAELYLAAGVVDDWAYGELGLMAFVPELRPSFDGPGDFVVDPSQIMPTCEEALAGLYVLAQWAGADVDIEVDDTGGTDGTGGPQTGGPDGTAEGPADEGPLDEGPADEGTGPQLDEGPLDEGPVDPEPASTDDDGAGTGGSSGDAGQSGVEGRGCACTATPTGRGTPSTMLALLGLWALRRRG